MTQFPKARPTKGNSAPRKPRNWGTHVLLNGGQYDWDGVPFCDACGMRGDHKVHDLNQSVVVEAAEIDRRIVGEGGN